jgi:hypothetical protein
MGPWTEGVFPPPDGCDMKLTDNQVQWSECTYLDSLVCIHGPTWNMPLRTPQVSIACPVSSVSAD